MTPTGSRWIGRATYKIGCLALVAMIVGYLILCFFASASTPPLEPERISAPYDPEAIPPGLHKKLPPITDPDGMRDTFFYPDGLGKGRIVHMRFPADYVLPIIWRVPPRHGDTLGFEVVYPELKSIVSKAVAPRREAVGGRPLDEQMEIGVIWPGSGDVDSMMASMQAAVEQAKEGHYSARFEEIAVPTSFYSNDCAKCSRRGVRVINVPFQNSYSTGREYYAEWDERGTVTRMLACEHTFRPRCALSIRPTQAHPLFILMIDFHLKYVDQLPEVVDAVGSYFNSAVVEIL